MKYTKLKPINLKSHSTLDEKWVQEVIAEDPNILGLGELELKDKERIQQGAGRLDLLLQDPETKKRYEVELQLGQVDESHIIRTIEYWDIERKRYPQYEHVAVIIAEDITSRFLNIISLFNGNIPLIALQMTAIETENGVGLSFVKVIDEVSYGLVDEDEEIAEVTDRAYWESKSNKKHVGAVDKLFTYVNDLYQGFELKYNKYYVGLFLEGRACNIVSFKPKKNFVNVNIKITNDSELRANIEDAGITVLDYDGRGGMFRIQLKANEIDKFEEQIKDLIKRAYEKRNN